jgi:hypothetical protein
MRVSSLCVLVAFAVITPVMAQQDTTFKRKVIYFNQVNSGILFGKRFTGNTVTASTIHGARVRRLSLGVGLGYEIFSERELMPVFGSISFELVQKEKHSLFVEANYGYSKAWHISLPYDPLEYREHGGRLLHGAVGYRRRIENFSFYVKAGYKNQIVRYDEIFWWPSGQKTSVTRQMERVTLSIGFGLN